MSQIPYNLLKDIPTSKIIAFADQVRALNAGLRPLDKVYAATTENIGLSGDINFDGVTIPFEERVLVKNQTVATENGIYLKKVTSWIRTVDFDENSEVQAGSFTYIENGTENGDTTYMVSNQGSGTNYTNILGTDPIRWTNVNLAIPATLEYELNLDVQSTTGFGLNDPTPVSTGIIISKDYRGRLLINDALSGRMYAIDTLTTINDVFYLSTDGGITATTEIEGSTLFVNPVLLGKDFINGQDKLSIWGIVGASTPISDFFAALDDKADLVNGKVDPNQIPDTAIDIVFESAQNSLAAFIVTELPALEVAGTFNQGDTVKFTDAGGTVRFFKSYEADLTDTNSYFETKDQTVTDGDGLQKVGNVMSVKTNETSPEGSGVEVTSDGVRIFQSTDADLTQLPLYFANRQTLFNILAAYQKLIGVGDAFDLTNNLLTLLLDETSFEGSGMEVTTNGLRNKLSDDTDISQDSTFLLTRGTLETILASYQTLLTFTGAIKNVGGNVSLNLGGSRNYNQRSLILDLIDNTYDGQYDYLTNGYFEDGTFKEYGLNGDFRSDVLLLISGSTNYYLLVLDITAGQYDWKVYDFGTKDVSDLQDGDTTTSLNLVTSYTITNSTEVDTSINSISIENSLQPNPSYANYVSGNTITDNNLFTVRESGLVELFDALGVDNYEEISYAALKTKIDERNLVIGRHYLIKPSERRNHPNLNGLILTQAMSHTLLSRQAHYLYYSPNYDIYPIWDSTTTADVVIWDAQTWKFVSGSKSTEPNPITADWILRKNEIFRKNCIDYDFESDRILYRKDEYDNEVKWAGGWKYDDSFQLSNEEKDFDGQDLGNSPSVLQRGNFNTSVIGGRVYKPIITNTLSGEYVGIYTQISPPYNFALDYYGTDPASIPTFTNLGTLGIADNGIGSYRTIFDFQTNTWKFFVSNFGDFGGFQPTIYALDLGADLTNIPSTPSKTVINLNADLAGSTMRELIYYEYNSEIYVNVLTNNDGIYTLKIGSDYNSYTYINKTPISATYNLRLSKMLQDGNGDYYQLFADAGSFTSGSDVFIISYGNSPENVGTQTSLNLTATLNATGGSAGSLELVEENGSYYGFVGTDKGFVYRLDFGTSITPSYTFTDFGDFSGAFFAAEFQVTKFGTDKWYIHQWATTPANGSRVLWDFPESSILTATEENIFNVQFIESVRDFQWDNPNVSQNVVDTTSYVEIINNRGVMKSNKFSLSSRVFNLETNTGSQIISNEINSTFAGNLILNDTQIVLNEFNSGDFGGMNLTGEILNSKKLESGISTFWMPTVVTGLSTVDLSNFNHIGETTLISTNATETITTITMPNNINHRLKIEVNTGLTVTFQHGVSLLCEGGVDFIANGSNYDYIVFEQILDINRAGTGIWRQVGGKQY